MPQEPRLNERRFYRYPRGRVVAVFDDQDAVQAAVVSVRQAGVDPGDIHVLSGPEGAQLLDRSGRSHGLRGRLVRVLQGGAYEGDLLVVHEQVLRSGGSVVYVPARSPQQRASVVQLLQQAGGRDLLYFRRWSIEPL